MAGHQRPWHHVNPKATVMLVITEQALCFAHTHSLALISIQDPLLRVSRASVTPSAMHAQTFATAVLHMAAAY